LQNVRQRRNVGAGTKLANHGGQLADLHRDLLQNSVEVDLIETLPSLQTPVLRLANEAERDVGIGSSHWSNLAQVTAIGLTCPIEQQHAELELIEVKLLGVHIAVECDNALTEVFEERVSLLTAEWTSTGDDESESLVFLLIDHRTEGIGGERLGRILMNNGTEVHIDPGSR
jgi:hypothetical protein